MAKYKIESMKGGKGKLFWHIHHTTLLEKARLPIQKRVNYIKHTKPTHEAPARLACLKPVKRPDLLPLEIRRAFKSRTSELRALVMEAGTLLDCPELFRKVMARHRKEYPKCNCSLSGRINFKNPLR